MWVHASAASAIIPKASRVSLRTGVPRVMRAFTFIFPQMASPTTVPPWEWATITVSEGLQE